LSGHWAHVWARADRSDAALCPLGRRHPPHPLPERPHDRRRHAPSLSLRHPAGDECQGDRRHRPSAWAFAERHPKEFETQITSTLNRFNRLLGPQVMKATFGQPDVSLDLLTALNDGAIILVNLSTEGGQIDEEDADTFATLLLTDLWSAAKARGKQEREKTRPSTSTSTNARTLSRRPSPKNLDQARGFGLHLTLANQFPSQFLNAGESGKAMYDSISPMPARRSSSASPTDGHGAFGQVALHGTFDTDAVKSSSCQRRSWDTGRRRGRSIRRGAPSPMAVAEVRGAANSPANPQAKVRASPSPFDPEHPENQIWLDSPFSTTKLERILCQCLGRERELV